MKKHSNKELIVTTIVVGMFCVFIQCLVANSTDLGFAPTDLSVASSGLKALMVMMMDWKAIIYVGIPVGMALFGICKLLRVG